MPRKNARRRVWGSITEVVRGKKYILRWVQNTPEGRKRKTETFYGTYSQADKHLNEIRLGSQNSRVPTVGELWEAYEHPGLLEGVERGCYSLRTLKNYESKWKAHVAPRWASCPCTEVRVADVQEWLLTKSKSCGKIARAVLKITLDHAVMLEYIQSNPAAKDFRYGEDTAKQRAIYTPEQLQQTWEAVRGTVAEVPFMLSAFAGLRVGEACGVALDCVEYREGHAAITVVSQATEQGEDAAPLKTQGSVRRVPLLDPYATRLRELTEALPEWAAYTNDDGTGRPVRRWAVSDAWEQAIKASDLPYLPMQTLRPAYETHLHWQRGLEIEKVSRIMGHARPFTTLQHYDRPTGDDLINAVLNANS